jgi:Tol biopolymer transport system component/C-terminal processing protease CtpA/Prc
MFLGVWLPILALLLSTGFLTALDRDEALWLRYPALSPDGQRIVFSYRGDLFMVSSKGGEARPLTRHEAYDFSPVWSPDGQSIAFASDRYGNFDLFVIPADGGEARRLTFHSADDVPSAFGPDGNILFYSSRMDSVKSSYFPSGALPELYSVNPAGGRPSQVLTCGAVNARQSSSGQLIAYQLEKAYEDAFRKHDKSAFSRDVWLYDKGNNSHRQLTEDGWDDREPVFSPDDRVIYYLSERSGSFNVWKMPLEGSAKAEQLSFHTLHPVRSLTISASGDLCYSFDGALYILGKGQKEPRRVSVALRTDWQKNADPIFPIGGKATEMVVSPNEKEIAFIARGEVFVSSVDHGTTKQITHSPEQERSVSFSPDGRKLLFASETKGSWNLFEARLQRPDEPYFYSSTLVDVEPLLVSDKESFQPAYSPDGKELAFLEERTTLRILNLASKELRTVLGADKNYSYADGDQWFQWSPDSRWLVVSFMDRGRWMDEVGLVDATGRQPVLNLTNSGYYDSLPKWGLGGKLIYWTSDRHGMRSHGSWGAQGDVYGLFLTREAWDRFNLSKEDFELLKEKEKQDEEKKAESEKNKGDKKAQKDEKKPSPLIFEMRNLEDRRMRLTAHSSDLADFVLTPDGEKLFYLARFEKGFDLWVHEFRENKTKLLAKLNGRQPGMEMGKEGKFLYLINNGSIQKVAVADGTITPISYSGVLVQDARKEREYLFEHVWRQIYKKFYRDDMHGIDWPLMRKEYEKFLPHISHDYDLAEMMSELLGELNASHTGATYRPQHQDPDATADLGLFFDPDHQGDGLKVLEVIERGPLDRAESKVRPGSVIEKINGQIVKAGENHYPLLNRQADRRIRLSLRGEDGKTWDEVVKPINRGELSQLLYQRWVKTRRQETERLSKGRLGYIHVRGMNDASFREVYSEALGRFSDKEGLVIDTRFNGGGNLHDDLANFLNGEKYLEYTPRGQKIAEQPIRRWTRKSVVIQNEGNYSDAHMFPYAYRFMKIGKLVGMPVPGTGTSVWWETLHNGTITFGMPMVGYVTNDGKYLENNQVEPDIRVNNDPQSASEGKDLQLEAAIQSLLADIEKK